MLRATNLIDEILTLIPDERQLIDCLRYYGKEVLIERLALARKKIEELKAKTGGDFLGGSAPR